MDGQQVKTDPPLLNKHRKPIYTNKSGELFTLGEVKEIKDPDNELRAHDLTTEYYYFFPGLDRFGGIGRINKISDDKKTVVFTSAHKYTYGENNFKLGKREEVLEVIDQEEKEKKDKQIKLIKQGYISITPGEVFADKSCSKIYYTTEDDITMKLLGYFNPVISSSIFHEGRVKFNLLFSSKKQITVQKSDKAIYSYNQLNTSGKLTAEIIRLNVQQIYDNYTYFVSNTYINSVDKLLFFKKFLYSKQSETLGYLIDIIENEETFILHFLIYESNPLYYKDFDDFKDRTDKIIPIYYNTT